MVKCLLINTSHIIEGLPCVRHRFKHLAYITGQNKDFCPPGTKILLLQHYKWSDGAEGWIKISHRKETWHVHQNSMGESSEGGLDAL